MENARGKLTIWETNKLVSFVNILNTWGFIYYLPGLTQFISDGRTDKYQQRSIFCVPSVIIHAYSTPMAV